MNLYFSILLGVIKFLLVFIPSAPFLTTMCKIINVMRILNKLINFSTILILKTDNKEIGL